MKQQLLFTSVTKAISASGIIANDDIQVFEIVPQDSSFGEQKMQVTYVNSKKTGFEDSYLKALKEGKQKWTGVQYLMYGPKSDSDP